MKTCDLPPSRLMEEKKHEHDVSSDAKKNLSCEFDQLAEVDPDPGSTGLGT